MQKETICLTDDGEYTKFLCPNCKSYNKHGSSWRCGDIIRCMYCRYEFPLKAIKVKECVTVFYTKGLPTDES